VKGRWLWVLISANLLALIALTFAYPHLMVSPGALVPGHADLATDCFACHAPLRGATAERCVACHALPDIGVRTTQGVAIARARPVKAAFHQELSDPDCMSCHSDHAGARLTQRGRKPFSHDALRVATRDRCASCHAAPVNDLHRSLATGCATCHTTAAWKPASFDHDTYFPLDADHKAPCTTCHGSADYTRYSCYGCHAHTPAGMAAKHAEEGLGQDLDNCVRCHRNASGEGEGRHGGEGGEGGREKD